MPLLDENNDDQTPSEVTAAPQPPEALPFAQAFGSDQAGILIRRKIAAVLAGQPTDGKRLEPAVVPGTEPSRHELFLYDLLNSNRSLAETVAAWHDYYAGLPEAEQQEVWQEFYAPSQPLPLIKQPQAEPATDTVLDTPTKSEPLPTSAEPVVMTPDPTSTLAPDLSVPPAEVAVVSADESDTTSEQPNSSDDAANADAAPQKTGFFSGRRQLRALAIGLGCGLIVAFISLFTFFNQQFIAPFIQPAKRTSQVPVIIGQTASEVDPIAKVVIPKINVEIPVDYSLTTTEEASVETALEGGVVHYPSTVMPGQAGNAAFFGHSSNNIFNPGKYKFAFVLLHELAVKDIFYLNYKGTLYAYEVISSQIVSPSDVAVLGPVSGQTATATLITCDPPGTSINRLVVVGKQISPDPSDNPAQTTPTTVVATAKATTPLPGNSPSLFQRIKQKLFD